MLLEWKITTNCKCFAWHCYYRKFVNEEWHKTGEFKPESQIYIFFIMPEVKDALKWQIFFQRKGAGSRWDADQDTYFSKSSL